MSNCVIQFINENKLVLVIVTLIIVCVVFNVCFSNKIEKMTDTTDNNGSDNNGSDNNGSGTSDHVADKPANAETITVDNNPSIVAENAENPALSRDPFADKYKDLVSNEDLWSIQENKEENNMVPIDKISYENLDNIKVMRLNNNYFDKLEKEIPSENLYLKCTITSQEKVHDIDTYVDHQYFLGRFTVNDCKLGNDLNGGCGTKSGLPVLIPLKNALATSGGLETHEGSKTHTTFKITRHQEGSDRSTSKYSLGVIGTDKFHNSGYLSQSSLIENSSKLIMCFDSTNNPKYCRFKLEEWGDGYLIMFMNPIKKVKKDEAGKIVKNEELGVVYETDEEGNDVYEQTSDGTILYDIFYISACVPEIRQCDAYSGVKRLCLTVNKSAALAFKFVRFRKRNSANCVQSCADQSEGGIEKYRESILKRLFPEIQKIVSSMQPEAENVNPSAVVTVASAVNDTDSDSVDADADNSNNNGNVGGVNE